MTDASDPFCIYSIYDKSNKEVFIKLKKILFILSSSQFFQMIKKIEPHQQLTTIIILSGISKKSWK